MRGVVDQLAAAEDGAGDRVARHRTDLVAPGIALRTHDVVVASSRLLGEAPETVVHRGEKHVERPSGPGGHVELDDDLVARDDRRVEPSPRRAVAPRVRSFHVLALGIVDPQARSLGHVEAREAEVQVQRSGRSDAQAPQVRAVVERLAGAGAFEVEAHLAAMGELPWRRRALRRTALGRGGQRRVVEPGQQVTIDGGEIPHVLAEARRRTVHLGKSRTGGSDSHECGNREYRESGAHRVRSPSSLL